MTTNIPMKDSTKLEVIDVLRGLAALSVTWFHFTNGNQAFLEDGFLKFSGEYGWLGVEVFFVISGFIIPYSLYRSDFKLYRHWKTFLIKRILRIFPAYLISLFIIIFLWYFSSLLPIFKGSAPNISFLDIFLHFTLLTGVFNQNWLSPAFWTLAIEFQYYLLIVIAYPLLSSIKIINRILIIFALLLLSFLIPQSNLVFSWIPLFSFGMLTFQLHFRKLNIFQYILMITVTLIVSYIRSGWLISFVGLATALIIAFIKFPKILSFSLLGELSYSLYLLHIPIGGRIINIGTRLNSSIYTKILILFFALLLSLLASYIMYKFVEKPVLRYFKNLKYENPN